MQRKLFLGVLFAAGIAAIGGAQAQDAQSYPWKPVRLVVPLAAGGGVDVLARMVAESLRTRWAQPVIVENRAGAGGNIGAEAVFRAEPDGHTLLFTAGGTLVTNKFLFANINFEPEAFAPVSIVVTNYNVLVVHPKVPADNVSKLLEYAKANPDKLEYASPGSGTGSHLTAELFKSVTGTRFPHIPYKGTAPAMADILSGQVAMIFGELGGFLPHIRAGKLRALAVTSEKRHPSLPDVPAMNEFIPGFVASPWNGVVAAPKTPPAIATRISQAIAESVKQPDMAKRLVERQMEPVGSTPEELARFMRQELARWEKVVKTIGIKAE